MFDQPDLVNFEGTRYEWRAVEIDKGVWAGEWRSIPRGLLPGATWKRHGALKNNQADAEKTAYDYARYLSRKM